MIAKGAASSLHVIANNRRADCSHTFRSAEMSNEHARCARGKIKANNMADIEKEILLQFISSFSPTETTMSSSKPKETPVLTSKNIHEETRYIKFFACDHDHRIAEGCLHMIAELSAICNRLRSYKNQPLTSIGILSHVKHTKIRHSQQHCFNTSQRGYFIMLIYIHVNHTSSPLQITIGFTKLNKYKLKRCLHLLNTSS